MKLRFQIFSLALLLTIFAFSILDGFAQGGKNRKKVAWPDSLKSVTLEGTVLIDSTHKNIYFLDIDADSVADYNLAFGPVWYTPESGATRPEEGDYITIVVSINPKAATPVAIVFEINDLQWREPIENWWRHQDWCDSLEVITVTGTILVDTTYYYVHYYLDENDDGEPDYFLSFGPPWYEPESEATHPLEGETVTIEGAVRGTDDLQRLVVFKINDLVWRDQFGPAPWTGRWVNKEDKGKSRISCPIDSLSMLEIPPGAMHGGSQGGHKFPDSVYCEFMQVYKDSLPQNPDSAFAGWHFHFTTPAGEQVNGHGKAVRFVKRLRMQLNIESADSSGFSMAKIAENDYSVKYWDQDANEWITIEEAVYDPVNKVMVIEPDSLDTYYAVFQTTKSTDVVESINEMPTDFVLEQNYPNPFNPETTIKYQIKSESFVKLSIYNSLGQEVRTLINAIQPSGAHQIVWNAHDNKGFNLPTGFYYYELQAGNKTQIRRMLLMK